MKKINEIFYSVQGEGLHAGTPVVFVRFSGCNLKCPFCDTKHQEGEYMTDEQIVDAVLAYPAHIVVFTGGEPSLQLDDRLCEMLHHAGMTIHVETNGTRSLPHSVDFITCSPKFTYCKNAEVVLRHIDELKVVFTNEKDMAAYEDMTANHYFLQPCDTGDAENNKSIMAACVDYCLRHPWWRISLQTQKILNVR